MKGIEFYVNLIWLLPFWRSKRFAQSEPQSANQAIFSIIMYFDAIR